MLPGRLRSSLCVERVDLCVGEHPAPGQKRKPSGASSVKP